MSDLISRTARLVPYAKRPKHLTSLVTAYLYEPEADDAASGFGNLYVIVEVLVSGRASDEVVDLIIETVGETYYNHSSVEATPLSQFEAAIKQVNTALSDHVGHGNAAWIGKLSAIIAVQAGHELHIAQTGSAEAFLYRGKGVSRISVTPTNRPSTPSKTFGSIATGELEVGDKLLLATPALIHQVPLPKLKSIIESTSPNTAISEMSQLVQGASTNRIAAIVAEITTPELAALEVRSDEPQEIQLNTKENFTDTALRTAAPIAQTTATASKKVADAAHTSWMQVIKPRLRQASFKGAEALRTLLSTRKGRRLALIGCVAGVIIIGGIAWFSASNAGTSKDFAAYQKLYTQYQSAQANNDKQIARSSLVDIQNQLNQLGNENRLNKQLQNQPLLQGEPTSVSGFKTLVADQIDQIDGLLKVTGMTVATIGSKNSRPTFLESDGSKAYIINPGDNNRISIVNLTTGVQTQSKANTADLGDVKNTTISSTNLGMYILTSKPSVWLYRFDTDSLVEQTINFGQWPKAEAIASYGPNLYLLGESAIYKHLRSAAGYSPKTDYVSLANLNSPTPSAMAIDGHIYVATSNKLHQFLGTVLKQSTPLPPSLKSLATLHTSSNSSLLIGTSRDSNRIVVWKLGDSQLSLEAQIALQEGGNLKDALYDRKLGKVFALIGNRLVSFSLNI